MRAARRGSFGFVGVIACSLPLLGCGSLQAVFPPAVPENTTVQRTMWLDQNWTDQERFWFHHTSQGTATLRIPYKWFVALEQPHLKLFGQPGLLRDPDYLARFGFIRSPKSLSSPNANDLGYPEGRERSSTDGRTASNEHELPVGIVKLENVRDPETQQPLDDRIGFSCAACHSGQLEYNETRLLVDGGSAVTDFGKFRRAMGLALAYTSYVPGRFGRFADQVLEHGHSDEDREALEDELALFVDLARRRLALVEEITAAHPAAELQVEEGFTRLDALNRIGNMLFYHQLRSEDPDERDPEIEENLHPITAPVNPPPIFYASWFNWIQYDASIMQPMIRNAGEALGVTALVNLRSVGEHLYRSSVEVDNLYELEQLVAGDKPSFEGDESAAFNGLRAPRWPQGVLGPLDAELHAEGAGLYREICARCHLPPVSSAAFWNTDRANGPVYWTAPDEAGRRYLKLVEISVGTDSGQADVLAKREINVPRHLAINPSSLNRGDHYTSCPDPGLPDEVVTRIGFPWALGVVVEKVVDKWYDENGTPAEDRRRLSGYRPNCLQAPAKYRARPLEGIWATAPFLHNGSVPNLHELFQSEEGRSVESFYLGRRIFDPVKVGYVGDEAFEGAFELDPTVRGNLNTGHYFDDGTLRDGVVGPKLDERKRAALIEYLKHMDDLATAH